METLAPLVIDFDGIERSFLISRDGKTIIMNSFMTVDNRRFPSRVCKQIPHGGSGSLGIKCSTAGYQRVLPVSRLVWAAYSKADYFDLMDFHFWHTDGDHTNNRFENLTPLTKTECILLARRGQALEANSKLDWRQVSVIRGLRRYSPRRFTLSYLADLFGVSVSAIHKIINEMTWRTPDAGEPQVPGMAD